MDSQNVESRYGWVRVRDRASAEYALRMAGLPVAMIGLSLLLAGLTGWVAGQTNVAAIYGAVGTLFVIWGLVLRSGRHGTVVAAVFCSIAAIAFQLVAEVLLQTLLPSDLFGVVTGTAIAARLYLLVAAGLMAVSGLKGWRWLREHGDR